MKKEERKRKRLRSALVLVVLATSGASVLFGATQVAATPAAPSAETKGVFIVNCPFSHRKQVDPIVTPGPPGTLSAHMHDFFGNRSIDSNSTFASASGAATTCGLSGDRAGYWTPTLISPNGSMMTPRRVLIYYRNVPRSTGRQRHSRRTSVSSQAGSESARPMPAGAASSTPRTCRQHRSAAGPA